MPVCRLAGGSLRVSLSKRLRLHGFGWFSEYGLRKCFTFQPCHHSADVGGVVVFAENVAATEHWGNASLLPCRGTNYDEVDGKTKSWGGRITTICGGLAVEWHGRHFGAGKNASMDDCVFFYFSDRSYGCGLPLPL